MCVMCEASKTNKIVVNKTEVLDLTTGIVTDAEGNKYPAPQFTEFLVGFLAEEGACDVEKWANEGTEAV